MKKQTLNKARTLSFSHGIGWLVQSLTLMRLQPGRLLLIAVFMQVILGLTQAPWGVGFLVIISVPALSAGILEAFDVTRRGGMPRLNLLFRPLASGTHTGRLLMTGLVIFAIGILSMSLVLSGSEELLSPDLMSRIEQGDIEAITQLDPQAVARMILAFIIGISVSGTLSFFTIPLIWFGGRTLGPALIEGLRALVFNWKPFLALAVGLFLLFIPVGMVTGILFSLAGSGGVLTAVIMVFIMILVLAFQLLLFGTQYCSFRDIFAAEESPEPPPSEDDSQLLA